MCLSCFPCLALCPIALISWIWPVSGALIPILHCWLDSVEQHLILQGPVLCTPTLFSLGSNLHMCFSNKTEMWEMVSEGACIYVLMRDYCRFSRSHLRLVGLRLAEQTDSKIWFRWLAIWNSAYTMGCMHVVTAHMIWYLVWVHAHTSVLMLCQVPMILLIFSHDFWGRRIIGTVWTHMPKYTHVVQRTWSGAANIKYYIQMPIYGSIVGREIWTLKDASNVIDYMKRENSQRRLSFSCFLLLSGVK